MRGDREWEAGIRGCVPTWPHSARGRRELGGRRHLFARLILRELYRLIAFGEASADRVHVRYYRIQPMTFPALWIPRRTACALFLLYSGCAQDDEPAKDPCAAVPIEQCDGLTLLNGPACMRWGGALLDYERECRGQGQVFGCVSQPDCEPTPVGAAQDPDGKRWLVTYFACLPHGWKQLRNGQVAQWRPCP